MIDDAQLLQRYAEENSEPAFAELVARYLDLVYAAAFRQVNNEHQAKDIAQTVFIDLARKARSLRGHPALASWLYTSTRFAALKTRRTEQRRQVREQEAHHMQQLFSSDPTPAWERLRPVLDDAMHELTESDREIVLLRYFRGLPFAELAGQLNLKEGTVRMRADRALDKMSGLLGRRGINSTAAALAVALGNQAVFAAPAGLAASISGIALTTVVGSGALAGTRLFFLMSKTKIAIVGLLVAGGITTAFIEHNRSVETQATLAALAKDREALSQKISHLTTLMAEAKARAETLPPPASRTEVVAAAPTALPAELPPPPGVTRNAPFGWAKNGSQPKSYRVGVDRNQTWGGQPSAYVESLTASVDGFGGMMQTNSAENFLGKRIRLSGWVKTEDANEGGGHLWLRVDGQQGGGSPLQFDNMDKRPVKGTTDWQQYSVVVDVPPEASAVAYGFFVQGGGKMWVSSTNIEPVGPETPSTNMVTKKNGVGLPKAPLNLSFNPDIPKT